MAAEADADVDLVVFWGAGCPYCADEWDFLAVPQDDYPDLRVTGYEVGTRRPTSPSSSTPWRIALELVGGVLRKDG